MLSCCLYEFLRVIKLIFVPLYFVGKETCSVDERSQFESCCNDFYEHVNIAFKFCLYCYLQGEWPSGLYSVRQVTEVKLGRVRSDFGWMTDEA